MSRKLMFVISVAVFLVAAGSVNGAIVNRYSFTDGDTVVVDSVGGRDGVLTGTAVIAGNQLVLDTNGTVELPGDILDPDLESVTIEAWFEINAVQSWQRIFAFGETVDDGGGNLIFYTPTSGSGDSRFVIATNGAPSWQTGEEMVTGPAVEPGTPTHIACVYDGAVPEIRLYQDGALVASTTTTMSLSGVARVFAYIGDALYTSDPHLDGNIDEFRIYDAALTDEEVLASFLAGPDAEIKVPARPTHLYTFEDGTANDSVGGADGVLIGGAAIFGGALVTTAQDQWMEMPGDVIAMNTYSEVTVEAFYTPTAGANTSWTMLCYFGDSTDPDPTAGLGNDGFFITSARGDDVSRAAISIGDPDAPYASESGANGPEYDDGLPHQMASTITATDITLTIDGALIATTPLSETNMISGISTTYAYLAKGGYGSDPEWIGEIEEFRIFDVALTEDELAASYAAGPAKVGPVPVDPGTDGLVAYYPLDSAGRGLTADASGNGLDGTLNGDPGFVPGIVGQAIDLDGDGDYVDCGPSTLFDMETNQVTVATWVTIRSVAHQWAAIVAKGEYAWRLGNASYDPIFHFGISYGGLSDTTYFDGVTTVGFDEWHHVAGVFDGATMMIYLDGALDNSVPTTETIGTSTANMLIGENPEATGRYWDGLVDEVYIYNRALSDLEVMYLAGL